MTKSRISIFRSCGIAKKTKQPPPPAILRHHRQERFGDAWGGQFLTGLYPGSPSALTGSRLYSPPNSTRQADWPSHATPAQGPMRAPEAQRLVSEPGRESWGGKGLDLGLP